jgi:hypothetical protein
MAEIVRTFLVATLPEEIRGLRNRDQALAIAGRKPVTYVTIQLDLM